MDLPQIIKYLGFLFGIALHTMVILVILRRREKEHAEWIFFCLAWAMLLWFGGQTIAMFFRQSENVAVHHLVPWIYLVSGLGLVLSPGLLVHVFFRFSTHRYTSVSPGTRKVILFLLYAPVLLYVPGVWQILEGVGSEFRDVVKGYVNTFSYHTLMLFILFALILLNHARIVQKRDERVFFNVLAIVIFINAALIFWTFPMGASTYSYGGFLEAFIVLTGLLPTVFFSYFIFRYPAMESVIRQGLLYFLYAFIILAAYHYIIVGLGNEIREKDFLDERTVEPLLLLVLFGFLQIVGAALRYTAINLMFAYRRLATRDAVRELSRRLSYFSRSDLQTFVLELEKRLEELLKLSPVRIILLSPKRGPVGWVSREDFVRSKDYENVDEVRIILATWKASGYIPIDLFEFPPQGVERALSNLSSEYILPIRGERDVLFGIFSAGRRPIYSPLVPEEKELLLLLVNQLAIVIDHLYLTEEMVGLQRRMVESDQLAKLGLLSASVAHEVRNPLSSINAIVSAMRDRLPQGDADREDLELVIGEINRLSRVVTQLVEYSRGKKKSSGDRGVLIRVLEDLRALVKNEASQAGATFELECAEDCREIEIPAQVFADALLNLLLNAFQAVSSGGKVFVRALLKEPHAGEKLLRIEVEDSGPGFPAATRDMVTMPFYTTKQTGTGLGLAIVVDRMKSIGGRLVIEDGTPTVVALEWRVPAEEA
ncbi:MAG: ATP-binding protein [Planctomycetes bacterium]|nr:ATP-binding protein [Planctomycetota bacterium]